MAQPQLIVLLENDFKNTSKNRFTKNFILPHVLRSTFTNICKPLKVKNTKSVNNGGKVIQILQKDIDSGSKGEDSGPIFSKVKIENQININITFNDVTDDKLVSSLTSREIKEEIKSDSDPDPFGDSSDDDSDFEVSIHGETKKKSTNSQKKNREIVLIKEENQSDESDYVPEEHEDLDEVDSDWNVERSPLKKKIKKEDEDDCDANKSIIRKLLDDASHYACTVCDAKVITTSEKETHRKSHNLRYLSYKSFYQCPDCAFKCSHSGVFRMHYQKHHSKEGGYFEWKMCTECPYKTATNRLLRQHLKHHNENGTFKCKYCSFSHNHKKNVTNHLRLHNKFLTGVYRCEECSYATKHSSSMFKHKKLHHTPQEELKWVYCKKCPFKSMELTNLRKHIKCHQLDEGYKCPHCTYRSPYACRITDHIKVHYAKNVPIPHYNPKMQTPLHSCTKCSYKTMTKAHLDRHMTAHKTHTNRRLTCAECPFTCKDKIDLVTHVKCHNGEGKLKCPWCSFSHFAQQMLTRHKRLHNDDRENIEKTKNRRKGEPRCPICNELFKAPSFVKRHMTKHQTLDQVENPVLCAHCPYKSKGKGLTFITHIQCHFKKEGLKCELCTFRHDRQNVMTAHMKLHKKIDPE